MIVLSCKYIDTHLGLDMIQIGSVSKVDLIQFSSVQICLIKIQIEFEPKDLVCFLIRVERFDHITVAYHATNHTIKAHLHNLMPQIT